MSSIVCMAIASAVAHGAQPADPSVARAGPLEIDLIVTDKGQELLTAWEEGAPHITIKNVETAKREEFLTAIVRFVGCAPDTKGLCNATVDYVANRRLPTHFQPARASWTERPASSALPLGRPASPAAGERAEPSAARSRLRAEAL